MDCVVHVAFIIDSSAVGGSESTKFINLIPPTVVAMLLQYSGYRV